MATCYFNNNLDKGYRCEYEVTDEKISVDVEGYDIEDENPSGISTSNTCYVERDILIVDSVQKKSYLLKRAWFGGMNSRLGTLDPAIISKFSANDYFEAGDGKILSMLPSVPKVEAIRIYSEAISDYYRHPSVLIKGTEDQLIFTLNNEGKEVEAEINKNNIKKIVLGDDWNSTSNNTSIVIRMNGYFGASFIEAVDYTDIYKYVREIMVYMQLYYPGKFKINKMLLRIDGKNYLFVSKFTRPIKYSDRFIEFSVKDGLLDFLKKCYINMPYRDTEGATRNIPYIIINKYRNVEDNFLMLFRFLEVFYKTQNPNYRNRELIQKAISDHYKEKDLSDEIKKKEAKEIVELRNHYVHRGYYIHESKLPIRFNREKPTPKDYVVEANVFWLRNKIEILYSTVIDVIFTELLDYQEYSFRNIF